MENMVLTKKVYTADQRRWCENYEDRTGFEPLMEDFEAGDETFAQAAQKSVVWFEDWSSDALLFISDGEMSAIANCGELA